MMYVLENAELIPLIKIKLLDPQAKMPTKASEHAVGYDICSIESIELISGDYQTIRTGVALEVPEGWECQVRSRSGLASKHGVFVLNSPGTIDPDYRGEIKVILKNTGDDTLIINPGDRIAQLIFKHTEKVSIVIVDKLSETTRGEGGFGSTGM